MCFLASGLVGCRGQAEFLLGKERLQAGDSRGAFHAFYEAWRQNPSEEHSAALTTAGRRVALELLEKATVAEGRLDFERALELATLALEYDPQGAAAREAYLRAWDELSRWVRVARRLEEGEELTQVAPRWRAALGSRHPLPAAETLEAYLAAAHLRTCPAERRAVLVSFAAARAAREFEDLEAETTSTFNSGRASRRLVVEALAGRWLSLTERLEAWVEWERRTAARSDLGDGVEEELARALARRRLLRGRLGPLVARAERNRRTVSDALDGMDLFEDGLEREKAGDLWAAYQLFGRVAYYHGSFPEAGIARDRIHERLTRESYEAAQTAMARREWASATSFLERLLSLAPDYRDARDRLTLCRLEATRESRRTAETYEARGLPGNALIRYLEALRTSPADERLKEAVKRLERELSSKLYPVVQVDFHAAEAEEVALWRHLWGVDADVILAAQTVIARAVTAAERGAEPDGPPHRVVVADLDFRWHQEGATTSFERGHALGAYDLEVNPAHVQAARELEDAERQWLAIRERYEKTPPSYRTLLANRMRLVRGRLDQARLKLKAEPPRVPSLSWEEVSRPVRTIRQVAELSLRLTSGDRWLTVRWETTARAVGSASSSDSSSAPRGVLDREAVLLSLASGLGELLIKHVDRSLRDERAGYYHRALERLQRSSADLAVEDLVHFLFPSDAREDAAVFTDAVRRLENLSGCSVVREWAAKRRPSSETKR